VANRDNHGRGPGYNLGSVLSGLDVKISAHMLLVAPTTFAASALRHIDFQADVVVIDEAAQATEPDIIGVLLCQENISRLRRLCSTLSIHRLSTQLSTSLS
jgi:hypothetical protein